MLSKPVKQIIVAAGRSAGISLSRISAAIAVMDDDQEQRSPEQSLLVNQATAARLLAVSRFTIRRMVADGVLHPIKVREADRYSRSELERLAEHGITHGPAGADPEWDRPHQSRTRAMR